MTGITRRPAGRASWLGPAAAIALWAACCAPASAAEPAEPPATQEVVSLQRAHAAYARPSTASQRLAVLRARSPITRGRTALPVIDHALRDGRRWLRVRLPGRPNGRTGWIAATGTTSSQTPWHLVVDVASRRVIAFRDGRRVRSFTAIVGTPWTPTPRGDFFIEEPVRLRGSDAGAPFALATSARSEVLQEFAGGPGQIAIHGVRNINGRLGTAVSHGCVRLSTRAITWLVKRVDAGTPLTIS